MRFVFLIVIITAALYLLAQPAKVAGVQEGGHDAPAGAETRIPAANTEGATDGALSWGLTGERRPLYRLHHSDVIDISFTFSPEFDQTVTVLPDGSVWLKAVGSIRLEGKTLDEVRATVRDAYKEILRDPEVSISVKDFEKPYFVAAGEVGHPGKYSLRAETTLTEAVAIAGGFSPQAKHSQVVLFRQVSNQFAEARVFNIKRLLQERNLKEDVQLRPGDLVYVPQNRISKVRKYIPLPNLGMYVNPTQF
ncbi:MAG TPA: polysaccharide biosynthesis/export family protein [Terriglobales bacterium]|nr:polysaccharide biosynthesis/export family protein [Terriglobales bacterium]